MTFVFLNKLTCNINHIKLDLLNIVERKWKLALDIKPKLRTLKEFKTDYKVEPYTEAYLTRFQRSLLSQYRCGILPLRVETGRFNLIRDNETKNLRHLNLEERLCQLCDRGSVEDEFHFTCVCPLYSTPRLKMFNEINKCNVNFNNLETFQQFVYINKYCQKLLAKYIENAWNLRKNSLFNNV